MSVGAIRWAKFLLGSLVLAGCSGGGGPSVPAAVPNGTGNVTIDMAGNWMVTNPLIVDTNDPTAGPPVAGTVITMSSDGIIAIAGHLVSKPAVEADLGVSTDWYVNTADGRTMMFGYGAHFGPMGESIRIGIAGGATGPDTISVEAFIEYRASGSDPARYARSRYFLTRASPVILTEPESGTQPSVPLSRTVGHGACGVLAMHPGSDAGR